MYSTADVCASICHSPPQNRTWGGAANAEEAAKLDFSSKPPAGGGGGGPDASAYTMSAGASRMEEEEDEGAWSESEEEEEVASAKVCHSANARVPVLHTVLPTLELFYDALLSLLDD